MKQWLRFGALASGLLLLLVTGFALYLKNLDFNDFKPQIQNMVQKASGRALTIEGRINLRLSLHPYLSVKGLHLANAKWGEDNRSFRSIIHDLTSTIPPFAAAPGQGDLP